MIRERREDRLTTADLATAGERPARQVKDDERPARQVKDEERLGSPPEIEDVEAANDEGHPAPLFAQEVAADLRAQWDAIQIGFVDDPSSAVRRADELVAQVMKQLAETFARERATLEKQLGQADSASTENLRVALRSYRSFFKRLLSL